MPTTPAGTEWTYLVHDQGVHGTTAMGCPTALLGSSDIPTIQYTHGSRADYKQFCELPAWSGLRNELLDRGWAWIEGDFGGPSGWGNEAAYDAIVAGRDYWETQQDLTLQAILMRSMGGSAGWRVAALEPGYENVAMIGNSAVSAFFDGASPYDSVGTTEPAQLDRATAYYFGVPFWQAWGFTAVADPDHPTLAEKKAAWDHLHGGACFDLAPENIDPAHFAGRKIMNLWGTADPAVPFDPRGAHQLRQQWAGLPALDVPVVREGGVHAPPNASYYDVAAMIGFLLELVGEEVEPPPEVLPTRILERYVANPANQRLYRLHPPRIRPTL